MDRCSQGFRTQSGLLDGAITGLESLSDRVKAALGHAESITRVTQKLKDKIFAELPPLGAAGTRFAAGITAGRELCSSRRGTEECFAGVITREGQEVRNL